ncbi:MAG: Acetyl-/propionyl-coenzyme A carboxylase alpha chain [Gammaproteobacteria bacterium]|nr:Acetyl-/propionyl-coenzyme A carboxylase alpha chain [Gammaproteobacteria bacterium]
MECRGGYRCLAMTNGINADLHGRRHGFTIMFKKILVANRGEIACRVFKSAQCLGINTVAVFSDADRDALHVRMADEAIRIGPPPSSESYLRIEKIIQACKETGAEAVHPGYGFLSENQHFAEALEHAGIAFVGPNVAAIQAMGDKLTSKKLAGEAGVNTIPGFAGVIEDAEHAVRIAHDVGYPVMLKASAGGGGKGMRVARDDAECRDGFKRATREAQSSFGDGRILVERFIEHPRHIEIQVLGDKHGNCIYLGERECSIQRRHQKVIEEAPSPFLDPDTRRAMGEQAVALSRAVDYVSAGTVEFIVDANKNFFFLEMNTRLQVEHPITEMVTGVDLVAQMLRIAAGEKLQLEQDDVTLSGWAIEARVYAEDPLHEFMPSSGRIVRYQPPATSDKVRIDTGVYEGGDVSVFYDPMMAKLITRGPDRRTAIETMRTALNEYFIRGVAHNVGFLNALIDHPRFRAGDLTTSFIAEEYPDGFQLKTPSEEEVSALLAASAVAYCAYLKRKTRITGRIAPPPDLSQPMQVVVTIDKRPYPIEINPVPHGYEFKYSGGLYRLRTDWRIGQPLFRCQIDGHSYCVQIERNGVEYELSYDGLQVTAMVMTPRGAELNTLMLDKPPPDYSKFLLSPMPGLLVRIETEPGQTIKAGEELAVVEAMKMENVLRAGHEVKVAKVLAQSGDNLTMGQPILEFE